MDFQAQGELVPLGGGDSIPLVRRVMTVGRRDSCDISLKFPNISGLHCELSFRDGYWFVRDMGSSNGIKVNGARTLQRPLRPGDELAIANRRYTVQYNINSRGQEALELILSEEEGLRSMSLLEKAGLAKPKGAKDDDDDDE
jgi:pSer/pThr/pTyr-binding forkhead associated (FHA) protein